MPILISPLAGAFSDRIGGQRLMGGRARPAGNGPRLDRWRRHPPLRTRILIAPFAPVRDGHGTLLRARRERRPPRRACAPEQEGQASGANNAIRELGVVFGVAVLASIFCPLRRLSPPGERSRTACPWPCTQAPRSSRWARLPRSASSAARESEALEPAPVDASARVRPRDVAVCALSRGHTRSHDARDPCGQSPGRGAWPHTRAVRYAALLRGINVGGRALIPMSDLRDCVTEVGHANVATYIASGNVIFVKRRGGAPRRSRPSSSVRSNGASSST